MSQSKALSIVGLNRDLFFGMRIRTTVEKLGYTLRLCKTEDELNQYWPQASLVIIDFNAPVVWEELTDLCASNVPVVALGSHTNVDGFRAAKAAGVTRAISNGEFSRALPQVIEKYSRIQPSDSQST